MRAIRMRQPGGPEVLELATAEPPETGPAEVLVAVELAAVNFGDVNARRATYASRGVAFQSGLGLEVYGRVAEQAPGSAASSRATG